MYLVPDMQYGRKDPVTFQWDGLVKELVRRRADVALAAMTINYPREQDVDFTKPYMDLGMRFVMRVSPLSPPRPFRFLDPLQSDVWIMMLVMTLVVGVYVSLLNKLSPYDHHGRYVYRDYRQAEKVFEQNILTCYKEYKKVKMIKREAMAVFNFSNSVWFSIATLLHQGGEAYPRSCSARLAMLTWMFAIVILVATYTANLAAFLTASRSKTTIQSIEDLAAQTKVQYGTVRSSAPRQFFEDSNVTTYKDILLYMTQRDTYVNGTNVGIAKARQGGYAYIFDSAVLDYVVETRPCGTLRNVGRLFGKIGYGIGLQKSSPHKDELSYYILKLREEGYMDKLVHKWYREKGECNRGVDDRTEREKAIEAAGGKLGISQLLGVFIIILGGVCLSLVVLGLEWFVAVQSVIDKKDPLRPASFTQSFQQRVHTLFGDFREEMADFRHRKYVVTNEPHRGENTQEGINNNSTELHVSYGTKTSPNSVISEDDIILSLAGSIVHRQRSALREASLQEASLRGPSVYTLTSHEHGSIQNGHVGDTLSGFTYGNPAFELEEEDQGEMQ